MKQLRRIDSIDEFVAVLKRSGLVHGVDVDQLINRYEGEYLTETKMPKVITTLCTFLVSIQMLTTWQCEKLRHGQWKGFGDFESFELLDQLDRNNEFGYYLARDIRDGRIVRLEMTPMSRTKDGKIEFRVDQVLIARK